MHALTPQGYATVNTAPTQLAALARRAKLEHQRDAAIDLLCDLPMNPMTSETRKYLADSAAKASAAIEVLNAAFGLVDPIPVATPLS